MAGRCKETGSRSRLTGRDRPAPGQAIEAHVAGGVGLWQRLGHAIRRHPILAYLVSAVIGVVLLLAFQPAPTHGERPTPPSTAVTRLDRGSDAR